jgi:hypothetical protein
VVDDHGRKEGEETEEEIEKIHEKVEAEIQSTESIEAMEDEVVVAAMANDDDDDDEEEEEEEEEEEDGVEEVGDDEDSDEEDEEGREEDEAGRLFCPVVLPSRTASRGASPVLSGTEQTETSSINHLFQSSQEDRSLDQLLASSLFMHGGDDAVAEAAPRSAPKLKTSESRVTTKDNMRKLVAQEILSTEASYVHTLQVLEQQFISPLVLAHKARQNCARDDTITKRLSTDEISRLHRVLVSLGVSKLLALNRQFCAELKKKSYSEFGPIFSR